MRNYLKTLYILTLRELRSYFDNITSYVVLLLFLLLWEFLFFRDIFLYSEASLRILFDVLPWLLLILVPAVTMGTIAQMRSEGTIEYSLTQPITPLQFLLSKFLASFKFVAIAILLTLPVAVSLSFFGKFDLGILFSQYLGSLFLASATVSIGIFVSSLFKSQMAALITSAFIIFVLTIVGSDLVTLSLPLVLTLLAERISLMSHFSSVIRGVLDIRDIIYFLSLTVIFLSLSLFFLLKTKYAKVHVVLRRTISLVTTIIGIGVVLNVLANQLPYRLDLSQGKLYSLSPATKKIVKEIPDVVNITVYASSKLPTKFQPVLRDTKDILRDYQLVGGGKIHFEIKNPDEDATAEEEAGALGINAVQFNVIDKEEFKVQKGYLGLNVTYQGKNEMIPFIQSTADLEYQLTGFIKGMTSSSKKKIVFLQGHGEGDPQQMYPQFEQELQKQYDVSTLTFDDSHQTLPDKIDTLIIAGPTEKIPDDQAQQIVAYLKNGGSALILVDGVLVSTQTFSAQVNQNRLEEILLPFGVKVNPTLLYDLGSNENVTFSGGAMNYVLPYPFWVKALPKDSATATYGIESVTLPWASPVNILNQSSEVEAQKLLVTSSHGGHQSDSFNIEPNQNFSSDSTGEYTVAVSLFGNFGDDTIKKTRLVLVGDSEFLVDQFTAAGSGNAAFSLNATDWLAQDEALSTIRSKVGGTSSLSFEKDWQKQALRIGNLALVVLLVAGFGMCRLLKRRRLQKKTYSTLHSTSA